MRLSTLLPSDSKFQQDLQATGQISFAPLLLKTVKVGEMINGLLAKAPVLKAKPMKVEPLDGKADLTFSLKTNVLQMSPFHMVDQEQNSITLKGQVNLVGLISDLNGEFLWAKPTLQGCVLQGNQDVAGRMVIPMIIKGPLMNPSTSALTGIAEKLLGKALECEKNKFLEKAKSDGKKKLETEAKKALKSLIGK